MLKNKYLPAVLILLTALLMQLNGDETQKNLDPELSKQMVGEWTKTPVMPAEYPGGFVFKKNGQFEYKPAEKPFNPAAEKDLPENKDVKFSGKYEIDLKGKILILYKTENNKVIETIKYSISNIETKVISSEKSDEKIIKKFVLLNGQAWYRSE